MAKKITLVGGSRNHRGDGSDHAPVARPAGTGWLYRLGRPAEGKPSAQRIPLGTVEKVLGLYKETYYDLNIRHFHEKAAGRSTVLS